jgi:hypothetical protein
MFCPSDPNPTQIFHLRPSVDRRRASHQNSLRGPFQICFPNSLLEFSLIMPPDQSLPTPKPEATGIIILPRSNARAEGTA